MATGKQTMGELVEVTTLPAAFVGSLPSDVIGLRSVIEQAKQAWLSRTESEKTRIAYSHDLVQFLRFHGVNVTHSETISRFLPDDVTRWRDHLLAGCLQCNGAPEDYRPAELLFIPPVVWLLRRQPGASGLCESPQLTPSILPKLVTRLLEAPAPDTPSVPFRCWLRSTAKTLALMSR